MHHNDNGIRQKGKYGRYGNPCKEELPRWAEVNGLLGLLPCPRGGSPGERLASRSSLVRFGLDELIFGGCQDCIGGGGQEEENKENDRRRIMDVD